MKIIKSVKRQLREWERIFTNHLSDMGLISRICKEFTPNHSITKIQIA